MNKNIILCDTSCIDIQKIRYSITNLNFFSKKLNIYNSNCHLPLQNFLLYCDICKIIKKSPSEITIAVNINAKIIENLNDIHSKINKKLIDDCIIKENIINKICEINNFVPTIDIRIDKSTVFFDESNNIIESDDIRINDYGMIICELECIHINDKISEANWKIFQFKRMKKIDNSVPLFPDESEIETMEIQKQPQKYFQQQYEEPQQIIPKPDKINVIEKVHSVAQPAQKTKAAFVPSLNNLSSAISNLKKVTDDDQKKEIDKPIINPLPEINILSSFKLKHVVTKESVSLVDMMKIDNKIKNMFKISKLIKKYKNSKNKTIVYDKIKELLKIIDDSNLLDCHI